jgi:hypothetical protein
MKGVFANRNSKRDFVKNEIELLGLPDTAVSIAVAFFTEASVVEELRD